MLANMVFSAAPPPLSLSLTLTFTHSLSLSLSLSHLLYLQPFASAHTHPSPLRTLSSTELLVLNCFLRKSQYRYKSIWCNPFSQLWIMVLYGSKSRIFPFFSIPRTFPLQTNVNVSEWWCVYMCVCVRASERGRKSECVRSTSTPSRINIHQYFLSIFE